MQKISGLYTALVTPFDKEGNLDEECLRHLIRFQIVARVDGIVVLGTTGEAPTLTHREQEKIILIAKEEVQNKISLMVGTGSYSTKQTIENTLLAESLGADSVLIVTPYYNKPTQEGLFLHYKTICEFSSVPIMVYNAQGRTGQNIQTDTLMRIAELPTICGVKETSGNQAQIMEVIEKIGRKKSGFSVMSGDDLFTLPSMLLGGDGVISVIGNLVPLQMKALVDAAADSLVSARDMHYNLMPFMHASFMETNPIPIKAAMELSGIPVGECRLPLCSLTPENKLKMARTIQNPILASYIQWNRSLYEMGVYSPNNLSAR